MNPTPLERAAAAIDTVATSYGAASNPESWTEEARAAFKSIDPEQLAGIIHPGYGKPRYDQPEGSQCRACLKAAETAQAVINHLLGETNADY